MILELNSISKTYNSALSPALDAIDLQIPSSKIFGLLGPNGAGKSTLINIISGLLMYDDGEIYWKSKLASTSSYKSKLGLVPQDIALYPRLTAFENLDFIASQYNINRKISHEIINNYLQILGLYNKRNQQLRFFSGGMKRMVNIIAGLLHNPELLIMDEPTVGIDVQSKNTIHEFLLELNKEGISMLYTSHMMEEAEKLCDEIAIIDKGKILSFGKPSELVSQIPDADNLEDVYMSIIGKGIQN